MFKEMEKSDVGILTSSLTGDSRFIKKLAHIANKNKSSVLRNCALVLLLNADRKKVKAVIKNLISNEKTISEEIEFYSIFFLV